MAVLAICGRGWSCLAAHWPKQRGDKTPRPCWPHLGLAVGCVRDDGAQKYATRGG